MKDNPTFPKTPQITAQHVNPAGVRAYMGTITGGAELHPSLMQIAVAFGIQTGVFQLLGGLTEAEFVAHDFVTNTRQTAVTITRALEIIGGHGTISLFEGLPHIHIHLIVSYRDAHGPAGIAVVGGHCAHAVVHAIEYTLTGYDGAPIHRADHPGTGMKLWAAPPLETE